MTVGTTLADSQASATTLGVPAVTIPPPLSDATTSPTSALAATSSVPAAANTLEVSWDGFPLFTYPRSVHRFAFGLDGPADAATLNDVTSKSSVAAVYTPPTQRWEAQLTAPESGPWMISATVTIAGVASTTSVVEVPVVPTRPASTPITMTDLSSTTLAVLEWGDGPGQVGLEVPVEGETQTPAGIVWVAETAELVIIDRVNERLVVINSEGAPIRTIPLEVSGVLNDGVVLPDGRLLVAEVGRGDDGQAITLAHMVELANGKVETTEAVEIPVVPGTFSLRVDPPSGLVYVEFGELYPYYDTRAGALVASETPASGWGGVVTNEAQAGILSAPDYLAATFPLQPAVTHVEATPTEVWATIDAADWDLVDEEGINPPVYNWLVRFPFDGSPVTASPIPLPQLWTADNIFAVRPADIILMLATDSGLELRSYPTTN